MSFFLDGIHAFSSAGKMIKLQFFGAAGEVTGSCYVVTSGSARVMVDMGMYQGERDASVNNRRLPSIDLNSLDAVVLTHAHLDHCGRLPMLVLFIGVVGGLAAWGFTGMFIGATTLAIFWTMIQAWLRPEGPAGAES